jgi:hypothetical protein
MFTYLLMLTLMSFGANGFVVTIIQQLMIDRRVSFYDARGFFLLLVVFLTFAVSSLAYFWGEVRFSPGSELVSKSLIGVFYALACNLACLLYGFIYLRHVLKAE